MSQTNINSMDAHSEFVFQRTYSRWLPEQNRRETYKEAVNRYVDFLKSTGGALVPEKVYRKITEFMLSRDCVGSMRLFWTAGKAATAANVAAYNCAFVAMDCIEAFAEMVYVIMCGTGCGFSCEKRHIEKLPLVQDRTWNHKSSITINDDKEGWADSIKQLMNALYAGWDVDFDYSLIRPKGSKLHTMGGKSSGPLPLVNTHVFIREVFNGAQGRQLIDLEVHDICCQIAEMVVVGGVRRSALISLSDLESSALRTAKSGHTFPIRRHSANNSWVARSKPDPITFMEEWTALAKSGSGERGIINLGAIPKDTKRKRELIQGVNPCFAGDVRLLTVDGYKTMIELWEIGGRLNYGDEAIAQSELKIINRHGVASATAVYKTSEKSEIYEVTTENGYKIKTTANHTFIKFNGQEERCQLKDLKIGDVLMSTAGNEQLSQFKTSIIKIELIGEEPTFCLTEHQNHEVVANGIILGQCAEISLRNGQMCNLSEVIIRPNDDIDDLLKKVETATWIGLIQSMLTNFVYLRPMWKENCEEERLLGVSLTGQMDSLDILTDANLAALRRKARKTAKQGAKLLGINEPTAITCGKPSGTVSQVMHCGSGAHVWWSKYMIRRYRISASDPVASLLKHLEVPLIPENGQENLKEPTLFVVEFPLMAPEGAITRHQITALSQLEHYKKVQTNWCDHNQSITVYVKPHEWLAVGHWVYTNWDIMAGCAFLPDDCGSYKLAPIEEITKEEHDRRVAAFPKIDYSLLSMFEQSDNTEGHKSFACTGDKCELK